MTGAAACNNDVSAPAAPATSAALRLDENEPRPKSAAAAMTAINITAAAATNLRRRLLTSFNLDSSHSSFSPASSMGAIPFPQNAGSDKFTASCASGASGQVTANGMNI